MTCKTPTYIRKLLQSTASLDGQSSDLIETHLSWILLIDNFAYKIKKPVHFDFVDYSTYDQRLHCCEEEIRINRRYAKHIYISVAYITGTEDEPILEGSGDAFECAVKMLRFNQSSIFSSLVDQGQLTSHHLTKLARLIATFHASIPTCESGMTNGYALHYYSMIRNNLNEVRLLLTDNEFSKSIESIHRYLERSTVLLNPLIEKRHDQGFVRDCHGDLHLGNLALSNGEPFPFDGIDFSDNLRCVDTIDEISFLIMDLEAHDSPALAFRFLNEYLDQTGDYAGLALLDYYRIHRALIRVKVSLLSPTELTINSVPKPFTDPIIKYFRCCDTLARRRDIKPFLLITHGYSGSGKSTAADFLSDFIQAIRIKSDIVRKTLGDHDLQKKTNESCTSALYSETMTERTYDYLCFTANSIMRWGYTVILDATFLKRKHREQAQKVANTLGFRFFILDCTVPFDRLSGRIIRRFASGLDPSDADIGVLNMQVNSAEALTAIELCQTLKLDMTNTMDLTTTGQLLKDLGQINQLKP
jgi:aminoglycoside phosphotransferase family enzyme/predicted kinase